MLTPTLTHYWPWDGDEQTAVCGVIMPDTDHQVLHSLEPTCPDCAAYLKEQDAYFDDCPACGTFAALSADMEQSVSFDAPLCEACRRAALRELRGNRSGLSDDMDSLNDNLDALNAGLLSLETALDRLLTALETHS